MKFATVLSIALASLCLTACDNNFSNTKGSDNFWQIPEPADVAPLTKLQETNVSLLVDEARALAQSVESDLDELSMFAAGANRKEIHEHITTQCEVRTRTESTSNRSQISKWSEDRYETPCAARMSHSRQESSSRVPTVVGANRSSEGEIFKVETTLSVEIDDQLAPVHDFSVAGVEVNRSMEGFSRSATLHEPGIETERRDVNGSLHLKNEPAVEFSSRYRREIRTNRVDDARTLRTGRQIQVVTLEMPFGPVVYKKVTTYGKDGETESKTIINGKVQE